MRLARIAVVLLLVGTAEAQATGPTLNHCIFSWDEGAVADNDLASFRIYLGTTPGGPYVVIGTAAATNTAGGTSYTTGNLCAGQTNGQKYAVVTAVDTAGNESPRSNEVPFAFDAVAPPVPSNLRAQ